MAKYAEGTKRRDGQCPGNICIISKLLPIKGENVAHQMQELKCNRGIVKMIPLIMLFTLSLELITFGLKPIIINSSHQILSNNPFPHSNTATSTTPSKGHFQAYQALLRAFTKRCPCPPIPYTPLLSSPPLPTTHPSPDSHGPIFRNTATPKGSLRWKMSPTNGHTVLGGGGGGGCCYWGRVLWLKNCHKS